MACQVVLDEEPASVHVEAAAAPQASEMGSKMI